MTLFKYFFRLSLCLCSLTVVFLLVPQTAWGQSEKLGSVQYTPPKGWKKTPKENIVAFSELNEATGRFCIITLYGATPGTGSPKSDFSREWKNLVVKPLAAEANPETESESADGWTGISGGSAVEFLGSKAIALLTVFSGFGKAVSVLAVFNDESYLPKLTAFASSIEFDKAVSRNSTPPREESAPPAPSISAAAMHVASLVKEFETNEVRANQQWVGKRVRVYGTVNTIEIGKDGNIVLTFKSSISTYNQGRCFFNKSQSSRVAELSAHQEATVEGTVRGLGGGFDNSKAFLLLENCTVP